jgi:predicted MPP superfamily phosphohydrolase
MNRRKFIRYGALSTLGLSTATGLYSWQIEPFWLEFVRIKMPIKNLPKHLVGKTLMQISDLHVGTRFDWKFLVESLKEAKNLEPDFVVYTGDFVSYESSQQISDLDQVMAHAALGKYGTAAVLGNHDYGLNWKEDSVANSISETLERHSVHVLRNQKISLNGLTICGIDDYWGTNFHPENLIPEVDTNTANVLLCHNPDVCDLDIWQDYNSWILSGHTHGGQCKSPFLPPPVLPVKNKKYSSGLFKLSNNRTLYINRALGHLWQVRFNVRPEITVFELEEA